MSTISLRPIAPQPLPEPAALTVNVEATGRILCGGQPLADVPVELWDSDARGSHLFDDQLASGVTALDGTFHLRGGAFVYGRFHHLGYHARDAGAACNTSSCAEGYAWSEGFAHFWARRALRRAVRQLLRGEDGAPRLRAREELKRVPLKCSGPDGHK